MKKKKATSAFFNPRMLFGFALCLLGAFLALVAFGIVTSRTVQAQVTPPKVLFLTLKNAPDLVQCHGILKQEIIDMANTAIEDPVIAFEKNRRAHPHMIAIPPTTNCASALWRAARGQYKKQSSVDPVTINLRRFAEFSVFGKNPLAPLVGTNVNPANGVQDYQGETNIAIDPNNPLHMVAHSNTFFKDTTAQCQSPTGGTSLTYGTMALFGSVDGGQTWTYNCAPWHTSVTGGVTSSIAYFGSDPALAWDNAGNAYATYMLISQSNTASGASIVVARSTDNGTSWQQFGSPVVNGITSTTQGNDKEMMAIDNTNGAFSHPGRIFVIWDAANAEKIAYTDNGTTWTTVNFPTNTGAIGGNLVIGADGTVYVIWNRYNVETIVFSKSTNGGTTWTTPAVISTMALQSFGTNNLPPAQDTRGINAFGAIDIDRNPNSANFGTLYVTFTDFPTGTTSGADLNVYVIRSTNGGTSWSSRVKVNDDNFGATQFFPWLAVDQSDGTVNVSWLDSRIDPLNRKTQAVYARSSDGGLTFETNIPVTDNGANWRNNVNYADENTTDNVTENPNQYGDYTGIAALNRQVHPLWTDSRSFFPVADTQAPTRREDNATSTIVNCSAPSAVTGLSVNSSSAPSVAITWSAPAGWGTNATNGTYSVYRDTTPVFPGGSPLASGLTSTSYVDSTGIPATTYYYFVRAKNNCPGTTLTPMNADSAASASVVYGSAGTGFGTLQGTVTSGGNPVANVIVFAGTLSATTNGSGFYQIPGTNAGTYTVSTSPAGYGAASVNGVAVTDGGTTTQNLALVANYSTNCLTDTNFGDYSTGSGTSADINSSPGDVKLTSSGGEGVDQNNASATTIRTVPTATTWAGQTFRAGKTGNLTKISVGLGLNSGTTGTVTVEIHNISGTSPGATLLSSVSTLGPVTNASGTVANYTATFSSPAAVVSGTSYSVVIKGVGSNNVYVVRSGNTLANGGIFSTINSGGTWTAGTGDLTFTEYVTTPIVYPTTGNFISSVKDTGAVTGNIPTWGTLSWTNAALPAGTNIQFQAAASNSSTGPFNFVGPDGTAGTFFTNGGSLAQFNGNRYLKYKALLTTSNIANTPTLNDVTVCYQNIVAAPALQSVASRMTHGNGAGTWDLPLSTSNRVIEPRDGGGNYTVVFTYDQPVNAGNASLTAPAGGSVGGVSYSGNSMIVTLTGVTDLQTATLTTNGVAGPNTQPGSSSVQVGFLIGDVNGDGAVNVGDTIVVRNNSGATLDGTNFSWDVNVDGFINIGDTAAVRSHAGNGL